MKKLLTFAGVSALALITAAPDAFGAAGTYNPSCSPNEVTITFYGMSAPASGTTPTLATLGTATYKSGKWYKPGNTTPVTNFSGLGLTFPEIQKSISTDGIAATEGAKAFRADLAVTAPKTLPADILTGTTTCASAAPAYSMGVTPSSTLPTLSADDIGNRINLAYVVMYAANCAGEQNATCTLTIADKKATYKNTCNTGYGNSDGGTNWTSMACSSDAVSPEMSEDLPPPQI